MRRLAGALLLFAGSTHGDKSAATGGRKESGAGPLRRRRFDG
jgi:hypothetical protein